MATPPKREKFAAPPPRRGGGAKTAPPTRQNAVPSRTPAPVNYGSPASIAVKEMQRALLNFAEVAASTDITAIDGNKSGKQVGEQSRELDNASQTKGDKEHLGGSDPFGNFLIQQYVVGDPVGKQYLNVDVAGKNNRENASIENANLRGMIDSIKRLGTPGSAGGEKSVDGVWAYRTDKAVKNCYALTNAVVNFANDLGIKVSFSLDSFKNLIPKEYTALKDATTRENTAKELTKYINAAADLFKKVKSSVLNDRNLRSYIDQKKPFAVYNKEFQSEPLKAQEQKLLSANLTQAIPGVSFSFISEPKKNWISFNELQSLDNFKKFIKRVDDKINVDDPNEVKKYLDEVNKALQSAKF